MMMMINHNTSVGDNDDDDDDETGTHFSCKESNMPQRVYPLCRHFVFQPCIVQICKCNVQICFQHVQIWHQVCTNMIPACALFKYDIKWFGRKALSFNQEDVCHARNEVFHQLGVWFGFQDIFQTFHFQIISLKEKLMAYIEFVTYKLQYSTLCCNENLVQQALYLSELPP